MITQSEANRLFKYDPDTGVLSRRVRTAKRTRVGEPVGSINSSGYLRVGANRRSYLVHRVIWLMVYGEMPKQIDHIDHDTTNNRLSNLRAADYKMNSRNRSMNKRNTSGVCGVHWCRAARKWKVQISSHAERFQIGAYESLLDAACARKSSEADLGYHHNHGAQ